jgi:vitamin B12 transporter
MRRILLAIVLPLVIATGTRSGPSSSTTPGNSTGSRPMADTLDAHPPEHSPSDDAVQPARDYTVGEIVITATRQSIIRDHAPSPVEVMTRQEIDLAAGSSVAKALSGMPGVFMRSYGGSGSLHTCSIRGMSAEHTLVLLDGESITGSQNDQLDLGIISTNNIERVEVVRGGYSSLYGADAIGGVINLITRRPANGIAGALSSSLGSNGLFAYELGLSGSSDATGWRGTVRRETGRGDFAFNFSDGMTATRLRRADSDYSLFFADAGVNQTLGATMQSHILVSYSTADRGTPGPVMDATSVPEGRLNDRTVRARGTLGWTPGEVIAGSFNATYVYSEQRYTDVFFGSPYRSTSRNNAFTLSPAISGNFSPALKGTVGWDVSRSWIRSDEVDNATRWQGSMYIATEHRVSLPFAVPFEMDLFPSVRYDGFSDVNGDLSPKIGLNIGLLPDPSIRLRSSLGKSYRVPTFNDLYWKFGGNPDLRPERSVSFDAGVVARLGFFGSLTLDAGYFSISAHDRIIWAPAAGGLFTPQNITSSRAEGAEASVEWTGLSGVLSLSANSTWTTARKTSADFPGDPSDGKLLVYSPRQTVHVAIRCMLDPVVVSLDNLWIDKRFSDDLNEHSVPQYNVATATVRVSVPFGSWKGWVKCDLTNLLDRSYQVIDSYPMPGREVRVTVGADL